METILRLIIFVVALGQMVLGTILNYQGNMAAAGLTYGAGILCFVFSYITLFSRFKGLGIEAELKNKLDEADKIVRYLKDIAVPISQIGFGSMARIGFWSDPVPRREQYRLKSEIDKALKQIGIEESKVRDISREWHKHNLLVLASPLTARIREELVNGHQRLTKQLEGFNQPLSGDEKPEWDRTYRERESIENEKALIDRLPLDPGFKNPRQEMLAFLTQFKTLSGTTKEAVLVDLSEMFEDVEYYAKHLDFRRPNKWFEKDDEK